MFGNAVPLIRISGIQIKIDPSWVLIAALIVWSLSTQYFPALLPGVVFTSAMKWKFLNGARSPS